MHVNVPDTWSCAQQDGTASPLYKCLWVEGVFLYGFIASCGLMATKGKTGREMEKEAVPERER